MKDKMTIDKLAAITKRGFDELKSYIDKRFDLVDKRFIGVEKRIDNLDISLDTKLLNYTNFWHRKFSEHEVWLRNLDSSVAKLERQVGGKKRS